MYNCQCWTPHLRALAIFLRDCMPQRTGHADSFATLALYKFTYLLTLFISQGSVATRLSCGEIFNNHFTSNFLASVSVTELRKSFNICWSYDKNLVAYFFWLTVYISLAAEQLPFLIHAVSAARSRRKWICDVLGGNSLTKPRQWLRRTLTETEHQWSLIRLYQKETKTSTKGTIDPECARLLTYSAICLR